MENNLLGQLVFQPRLEPGTSRIQVYYSVPITPTHSASGCDTVQSGRRILQSGRNTHVNNTNALFLMAASTICEPKRS
jgi:hypothetical protein